MKRAALAVLLIPFVLQSLFAAGTMPSFSAQGFEVVICTDDGLRTIFVETGEKPAEDMSRAACEWGVQIHEVTPTTLGPYALIRQALRGEPASPVRAIRLARNTTTTIKARAPPLSV